MRLLSLPKNKTRGGWITKYLAAFVFWRWQRASEGAFHPQSPPPSLTTRPPPPHHPHSLCCNNRFQTVKWMFARRALTLWLAPSARREHVWSLSKLNTETREASVELNRASDWMRRMNPKWLQKKWNKKQSQSMDFKSFPGFRGWMIWAVRVDVSTD